MNDDPTIHHRKTIRLKRYDYSQPGAYFVTLVTQGRECLFGEINNGAMVLNRYGLIVHRAWLELPRHYPQIKPGAFCIMPNHVHGIIFIESDRVGAGLYNGYRDHVGAGLHDEQRQRIKRNSNQTTNHDYPSRPAPTENTPLSEIVRAFKSFSARRINVIR